ncbi:transketolase family protein [Heliobacillus mobilis]|uniref:Transketolase C-terminal section n=1 Tax=Heliobacterium mobile TaxID=28064 RepID=Q0PII0_HELMO|nr:transketolase family protein [Heliobacterium mobile]ABH04837.1 transketolase C-terminal section [Heliobacterium mobile]MTV49631.1 transketolase family protein [Heliobacterium mobile]
MTKIATRDAYGRALAQLGGENQDIVVLDADLAKSTKTIDFAKVYPERFFDMGIAEQNLIGVSAGLAAAGKIPFASTFAMFATGRAFEQIRNSVAYPKLNVKIAATHAGISVGEDGASHQTVEDIALMRAIPNMTVVVPADGIETEAVIRWAASYSGPVYIRLGRLAVPVLYDENYRFEWGKAVTLRSGKDVTFIATGLMVAMAMEAAELLSAEGIEAEVLNIHTMKPIDAEAIGASVQRTGAVVTAEEHSIIGGLGSAVAEVLAEHCPAPLERVGLKDTFGESGKPNELFEKYGLTKEALVAAAKKAVSRKK